MNFKAVGSSSQPFLLPGRVYGEVKITIEESPYGDSGAKYEGLLGMMNHFILQLKSFRHPNKSSEDAAYLEADIRGYQEVLDSGSQDNAREFLRIKQKGNPLAGNQRFENNEAVVAFMKEQGIWQSKT